MKRCFFTFGVYAFVYTILGWVWQCLELFYYGMVFESTVDTIIGLLVTYVITQLILLLYREDDD